MPPLRAFWFLCLSLACIVKVNGATGSELDATVTIAVLARNAAANLPWFLGSIERLNYPKDRISIW